MPIYLKVAVSALLISFLIYKVEWQTLLSDIEMINKVTIIIVYSVFTVQFPIGAYKWQKSLLVHGLKYPFLFLQKVLCIGFFFNNFLPTSIGGDAYRAIKTMPENGYKSRAVSAILVERIIGLAALLFLGLSGGVLILRNEYIPIVMDYVLTCLAGGIAFIALIVMLRMGLLSEVLDRFKRIEILDILTHNLGLIYRSPGQLANIFVISLISQLLAIVAIAALFTALGTDNRYADYALLAAIVGLVSVIPISINGIGVTESAFAMTAAHLGMDFDQAAVVAILLRTLIIPLSLACGLIYFVDSHRPSTG